MFNGILICFLFSLPLLLMRFSFHIFIGYLSFFVKCLFFPIFLLGYVYLSYYTSTFILNTIPLSLVYVANIFSQFMACLFTLLQCFLWTQTLNSIFFSVCTFCVFNSSLPWGHKGILYYLLNWSFKVLPFTFWSLTNLELIFVCIIR